MDLFVAIMVNVAAASTPLVFAAMGELVVEKSGVLNLGVEGMMLMGAIAGFAAGYASGSMLIGIIVAGIAGGLLALLFGFLTQHLLANQVATGLALTIFGIGISAMVGHSFVGISLDPIAKGIPFLEDIPVIGKLFFGHDILVYASFVMTALVFYFLYKTRAGLILRAVGTNHDAAHSIGYSVIKIRYMAIVFGGAMAGIGGAYLSMAVNPMWVEEMTAGRGWIALALVVFATWRPGRVLVGAYLFGGISILQLNLQAMGVTIAPQLLAMLPYLVTIAVLVIISRDSGLMKKHAPACLGKIFHASS
ncbi:ABC transporter permease [Curvivirga aplysinae]|uniref:ABC transporter permease n=1 Tax=Curvivirga aplysinae TaxID=2529852 RepID=UPI0012BBAE65|nr:ABC transporter permease [Curvivirga aplysinae]MTI09920.1 ABC transporter permease [Curvivirga aplysinae]